MRTAYDGASALAAAASFTPSVVLLDLGMAGMDGYEVCRRLLAETLPGKAISPGASAGGGQALLGWIQAEGEVNRVKMLIQPWAETAGQ